MGSMGLTLKRPGCQKEACAARQMLAAAMVSWLDLRDLTLLAAWPTISPVPEGFASVIPPGQAQGVGVMVGQAASSVRKHLSAA